MKTRILYYISALFILFAFVLSSCEGDDSANTKDLEGHWIYQQTKAEVYADEPELQEAVRNYIETNSKSYIRSYDFKNDRTYYYYRNYAEPIKGTYKVLDKNYFQMDDYNGIKTVISEPNSIYIISDVRDEICKALNLDEDRIIKVIVTDVYERGLHSN